ncbi:hypothetical protein [Dyella caseinilytica]|uniref:Toxin co-regulated pilus biosynthesis protein Q n=1 Tax=Dyella caseinilytica TaxID=1849581 RepID=A0ABX7GNU7_9GAMM|nr:hypothetical protein [Dyella caseinilytica]QRN52058.1 hypothetical protein ISN74_11125 [Dyella caseinilytica]GGA15780.1 hypothetical protein GCM10011408_42180 [Dyella caseinilytica]
MTSIFSIDATSQTWQPFNNGQSPAKDFAHELAKRDEQAKPEQEDVEKAGQDDEFANQQRSGIEETMPGETTASISQAGTIVQAETLQLEQATVTPTGVTQVLLGARVFGWHAMAQAYLSELTTADGDADQHALSKEQEASTSTTTIEDTLVSAENAPVDMVVAETTTAAPQAEYVEPVKTRQASEDTASPNITELAATDTAANSYWSERSIRFTRQRDGSSIAWLRDFRISDAEASHLVQFVLNDAKAKGMALSKIMLNGGEVWVSPTSH